MIDDPEKARKLARGVVSDIVLYNANKIHSGIMQDKLFELLAEEIKQGRAFYLSQISPELREGPFFFNEALVDLLFATQGNVESEIW